MLAEACTNLFQGAIEYSTGFLQLPFLSSILYEIAV